MPLHDGGGGFRIQVVSALDFFFYARFKSIIRLHALKTLLLRHDHGCT